LRFDKTLNRDLHSSQIKRCRFLQMPEGQSLQTGRCRCLDRKIVLAGGAILIEALIFKAKDSRSASRFSGIAEQQGDRVNLCG
jgi:hypothetical protein